MADRDSADFEARLRTPRRKEPKVHDATRNLRSVRQVVSIERVRSMSIPAPNFTCLRETIDVRLALEPVGVGRLRLIDNAAWFEIGIWTVVAAKQDLL